MGLLTRQGKTWIGALDLTEPDSIHVVSDSEELTYYSAMAASPDGRWVAWIPRLSTSEGAFIGSIVRGGEAPLLGPDRRRIAVEGVSWVGWSHRGDELFVLGKGRMVYSIPVAADAGDLQLGTAEPLFRTPSPPLLDWLAVSPDAQRFYFVIEPNAPRRTLRVLVDWQARLAGE